MKIQFPPASGKLASHLRDWAVPLVSVVTFIPLLGAYLISQPEKSIAPETVAIPSRAADVMSRSLAPLPPQPLQPSAPQKPASVTATKKTTLPKTEPSPSKTTAKSPVAPQPRQRLVVPANYTPPALEIRVAIERDLSSILIGVSGQAIVSDRQGQPLKTISASEGLTVTPSISGLQMGESSLPGVIFVQPTAKDGLVYVNNRWYRGRVLITVREKGLLVVNHVNLEEYLYSVVGSEMHSTAHPEALKAQAIAARSYALVHMIRPASPWFSLGNTQRWQVYKGIQSEYQSGHNAVNATAGQILSYKGGVVESLYAATDEIVSWAHGGRGMSQTGAYQLADRGYDYQQILANYYPGVGVARLVLQK